MSGSVATTEEPQTVSATAVASGTLLVAILVGTDQLLKYVMSAWLGPDALDHRWELAGPYLAFQYVENRGAAFGILEGRTALLIVLAVIVAIVFVTVIRRELARDKFIQIALVLIAAGAIGNLVDRIRLGYVIDFVALGVWPRFNLADCCITIAIVILAWTTLFSNPAPKSDTEDQLHD